MENNELRGIGVYEFIKENQDKLIIFGYGGTDLSTGQGYYCFGLVYKLHMRIVEGKAEGSSNRCILEGILAAVKRIAKPSDVIILTSTSLGFKQALKGKGPNQDICNAIMDCVEVEKSCTLHCCNMPNTADEMRRLLVKADRYFKVIY